MRRLFLLLVVGGCVVSQAQTNQCSLDAVSNKCADFKKDQPLYKKMPDGSVIPNYVRHFANMDQSADSSQASSPEAAEASVNAEAKTFQKEKKYAQILESASVSPEAKIFLKPFQVEKIMAGPGSQKIITFWPLNGENGKVQLVERQKVRKALRKAVGKDIDQLNDLGAEIEQSFAAPRRATSELEKVMAPTPESVEKVENLFQFAVKGVQKTILKGRSVSALSKEEKALYDKVGQVQFSAELDEEEQAECEGVIPNAMYSPDTNRIMICPMLYNFPSAAILQVIAHEVGHAIDPCGHQHGLFQLNENKLDDIIDNPDAGDVGQLAVSLVEGANENMVTPIPMGTAPHVVQELVQSGAVKRMTPDISYDKYPLSGVYQCFASKNGGGFNHLKKGQVEKMADKVVAVRKQILGPDYQAAADKKKLIDVLKHHRECVHDPHHQSQMGEVMADWVSGEVVADYLRQNPPKTNEQKKAAFSFFTTLGCLDRHAPEKNELMSIGVQISLDSVTHPITSKRLSRVILGHPELAKMAGCDPVSKKSCSDHYPLQKAVLVPAVEPVGGVQ